MKIHNESEYIQAENRLYELGSIDRISSNDKTEFYSLMYACKEYRESSVKTKRALHRAYVIKQVFAWIVLGIVVFMVTSPFLPGDPLLVKVESTIHQ